MKNLFKTKFDAAVIVLIPACIGINYLGKLFASVLKLPLWLDSIGTCIGAVLGGPVIGAVLIPVASSCVGFLANFPAFSGISRWQMVVVYVLMLFAILLKPEGLFGKKTIKKV